MLTPNVQQVQISEVTIDQLLKNPDNTRLHPQKNIDAIKDSLNETGPIRSVGIDENNMLIAGNGTAEAAEAVGIKRVIIVDAPEDAIVAVRKKGLTEFQKHRAGLRDNYCTGTSKNDTKAINRLVQANPQQPLLDGIFSGKEAEKLLKASSDSQPLAVGGLDDVENVAQGNGGGKAMAESSVKMLPVFLTTENTSEIVTKIKALYPMFGVTTITDCLVAMVRKATDEWLTPAEHFMANMSDEAEGIIGSDEAIEFQQSGELA